MPNQDFHQDRTFLQVLREAAFVLQHRGDRLKPSFLADSLQKSASSAKWSGLGFRDI